MMMKRFRW